MSARLVTTSRTGPSSRISRVCRTMALYERTTATATTSAPLHTWKSHTGSFPRVHCHVGSVIDFGFFVGYDLFRRVRVALRHRHKLAVLLCVGILRGWWRGPHETLLFSSAHSAIAEGNDSEGLNGGDVDVLLRPQEEDFDVDHHGDAQGHGDGLGCRAQEDEVQSQEWPALGEHGVLQYVADSGLGHPRAYLRPYCPGFRQGHHREQNGMGALHRNVLRAEGEPIQSIMRSVCGPIGDRQTSRGHGLRHVLLLPASSRKSHAWSKQMVSSLCGEYLITGWEYRRSLPGYVYPSFEW